MSALKYKEFKSAEEVTDFFNTTEPSVNIYHKPVAISRNKFDRFDVFYENRYYDSGYIEEYEEEE